MQKDQIVAVLREMADLLEITEANSFEVMAYRNGAQALDDWDGDLGIAVSKSTLNEIPSVGKGLSEVISELVTSGTSTELTRIRGLVPTELPRLLSVRGLGPKRVRVLWQQLGVEGPNDLKQAASEGRVQALRGFGEKTVERILSGIEYLQKGPTETAAKSEKVQMPTAQVSSGHIWAGTSGYSYPQWKGSFYGADARTDELLQHYSRQLATVEINNTFYRFPSEKVLQQWKSQTPAHFRFGIKAHRRITHQLRLNASARDFIFDFVQRCAQLDEQLGCILFQLPPDFSRDDARLDTLLETLPSGPRYAIEFRHASWLTDEIQDKLRQHNIACVSGDADDQPPQRWVTADFVYTRLRRTSYAENELSAWDEWFQALAAERRDVLVYLKHDDEGFAPASILERWGQPSQPHRPRKIAASKSDRTATQRKSG